MIKKRVLKVLLVLFVSLSLLPSAIIVKSNAKDLQPVSIVSIKGLRLPAYGRKINLDTTKDANTHWHFATDEEIKKWGGYSFDYQNGKLWMDLNGYRILPPDSTFASSDPNCYEFTCIVMPDEGYEFTPIVQVKINDKYETVKSYSHDSVALQIHSKAFTAHNLVAVPGIPATCTEKGSKPYYHCSICNKNFKDNNALNEITDLEGWIKTSELYHDIAVIPAKQPTILVCLGAFLNPVVSRGVTVEAVVYGALMGVSSTGLYEAFR